MEGIIFNENTIFEEASNQKILDKNSFFQEADDELDEEELHSDLEDEVYDDDETSEEETESEETSNDGDVEETETEEVEKTEEAPVDDKGSTEGPDDYDLKEFGQHGGPDVPNNQYNENDVEILNKLISSESDAINDYFDATTNTVDVNLSRLYGDIGREERFHLEQLLYAKSLITGEKYEPKDPEVKKEYEELIGQGMDEDTAIVTTMDKIAISKPMSDEEFEEMKEDVAQTESYLTQSELFTEMILESSVYPELVQEYVTRLDFYMEAVLNTSTVPKNVKEGQNPIIWLIKQFGNFFGFLSKLGKLIRAHLERSRIKRNAIKEYIHKHGLKSIFQPGYHFYTFDDRTGYFNLTDMVVAGDAVYKTIQLIARDYLKNNIQPNPFDRLKVQGKKTFNTIDAGISFINQILLTKTKCIITDKNEGYLTNFLFGYSGTKVPRVNAENHTVDLLSENFYNSALIVCDYLEATAKYATSVLESLKGLEGVPNTAYSDQNSGWRKSIKYMQDVMKITSRLIKALNHDINTLLKIDNEIINRTNESDQLDQQARGIPRNLQNPQ